MIDVWYGEPLTLIHGDSHLANCFEYPTPGGPRMGLIDFQGMHWCKGIRDVQYFLINSLEPDLLAAHEGAHPARAVHRLRARELVDQRAPDRAARAGNEHQRRGLAFVHHAALGAPR